MNTKLEKIVAEVGKVGIFSFFLSESDYRRIVPKSATKEASEENMVQLAQYGLMALFRQGSIASGISGGMLSKLLPQPPCSFAGREFLPVMWRVMLFPIWMWWRLETWRMGLIIRIIIGGISPWAKQR